MADGAIAQRFPIHGVRGTPHARTARRRGAARGALPGRTGHAACRAQLGLAEVALSDGKLAHVIHHYNETARIAPDKAVMRLARREADYYSRLNDDEDYLAAELRRMNWLDGAGRVQQLAARVSFAALLVALVGPSMDQVIAGLGWALASSSIIAWSGSLITRKLLTARSRPGTSDA